ncbi:MAG: nitroreductase family protein [Nitrososphaerota archaeon]
MDLMEIIKGRRAVRNFLDKEIAGKDLEVILEAGIWAPSGSNIQPWEFILVDDPVLVKKIKLVSPGLYGLPRALIVLCVNRKRCEKGGKLGENMAVMDVSMAAQNMMLMAYSLGIGSCPIVSFNKLALKQLLDIPEHVEPLLIISLGYPTEWPQPPSRRPLEEVVHVNGYGEPFKR